MSDPRGRVEALPEEALIRLDVGAPLAGRVGSDLGVLRGADDDLRRAAADLAAAAPRGILDDLLGDLGEAAWQLGDIGGILPPAELDEAARGAEAFGGDLTERDTTLAP